LPDAPLTLTTERLLLREYTGADLAPFLAYQSLPEAREFYGTHEAQPNHVRELLTTFQQWARERPRRRYQLAIAPRSAPDGLLGSVGLRAIDGSSDAADLGLELDPRVWGRGYGAEAATAMLAFGFDRLELKVVRGLTVSANARVAALVQRLGFRLVAQHPGDGWMQARGWTEAEWRLTRDEWSTRSAPVAS
jgi:RimJ/RimL family protein N-acetyltransferase